MVCEGLVKLRKAHDILNPIANSHASLGHNDLSGAIDMLHVKCIQRPDIEAEFNITLGKDFLTKQLQCDIYTVLYHAVENVFQHARASKITVHLNKVSNRLRLEVRDNGIGLSMFAWSVNFGLGKYVMDKIAKDYKTQVKRYSNRNGTRFVIEFPVILQPKNIESKNEKAPI